MFAQGFIDEVADLVITRGLIADSTAGRAIGFAQILAARAGQLAWDDVLERTIIGTRRYVRRQRSWFNRDPRIHWIDVTNTENPPYEQMRNILIAEGGILWVTPGETA